MKNCGKLFEEDFMKSFSKEVFVYRLRDSAGAWGGQGKSDNCNGKVRFTPKNICDFIVYSNESNKLLLLELKSFKGKSCPFTNLKEHQIKGLYTEGKRKGTESYIVLNFRDLNNETYAVKSEHIYEFYEKGERKSLSYEFCKEQGVLIVGRLKRTRWEYDVEELL